MDAGAPLSSAESASGAGMNSRRHPMHTCGVSLIALAHMAFSRSQDFDGLLGSTMKRMAASARPLSPSIHAIRYLSLAVLSFLDDYILAVESLIEILFPPSARMFNKIDEFIQIVEVFPRKLDDAINKFSMIIHQTPLLDYALVHLVSWLKFFLSSLTLESAREKEIRIDVNYKQQLHTELASPSHVKSESFEKFPPLSDTPQAETATEGSTTKVDASKCSYKEVVEKGTQENVESKEDDVMEEETIIESDEDDDMEEVAEGEEEKNGNKIDEMEDPLLKLFESSWHLTPPRTG